MDIDTQQQSNTNIDTEIKKPKIKLRWVVVLLFIKLFFIGLFVFVYSMRAPSDFIPETLVSIKPGSSVSTIAKLLQEKHIIRSPFIFQTFTILLEEEKSLVVGEYQFDTPMSVFTVIKKIGEGDFGRAQITVRLPEGETIHEYASILEKALPKFNKTDFIFRMTRREGYIYPDTYFFFPSTTTDDVIRTVEANFENRTEDVQRQIQGSDYSLDEVVIMASIIEKEATDDEEEQKIISGILWKRLSIGMPLQVDATFKYYLGKESRALTSADLKTDHPYNTYTRKGLPPGPIGNPSLQTMEAAANPTKSEYLYYLHDTKGNVYYAETFEQHKENKRLYLDS